MKNFIDGKFLLTGSGLLLAAFLTIVLKPTIKLADQTKPVNLEKMIPQSFTDWKIDQTLIPIQVADNVQEKLDKIYNQVLTRTYINKDNKKIMLLIAYGGDQSDNIQLHKPEVCYLSQGFQILSNKKSKLRLTDFHLPIKKIIAQKNTRTEPITYWTTIGSKVITDDIERKLVKIHYSFTGLIPDGMLIRVSSISTNTTAAFSLQTKFIRQLQQTLSKEISIRFFGHSPAADKGIN